MFIYPSFITVLLKVILSEFNDRFSNTHAFEKKWKWTSLKVVVVLYRILNILSLIYLYRMLNIQHSRFTVSCLVMLQGYDVMYISVTICVYIYIYNAWRRYIIYDIVSHALLLPFQACAERSWNIPERSSKLVIIHQPKMVNVFLHIFMSFSVRSTASPSRSKQNFSPFYLLYVWRVQQQK